MKRRSDDRSAARKNGARLFLVALIGVASVLLLIRQFGSPAEPVFEGRPLSEWLHHHVASSAAIPPYGSPEWKKADEALRAIGTHGLPVLVEMLRAKEQPKWLRELSGFANRHFRLDLKTRYASWLHEEAEYAFEILGASASNAVPELIEIYEQNISPSSQACTAQSLGNIGAPAHAALPALIQRFGDPDQHVRFHAVSAVMSIGGDPELVFPALTAALKDPFVSVRWNALVGLSQYGRRARPVVGEILPMLNDPGLVSSDSITQQVATTLWRIAPERIGHPVVVAPSAAIASNGVTTAPLKILFLGERKTLIPAGRPTPAIAQYWNSDPRPKLTLYTGETNEQLLGHFEVLGVPASPNVNISTLAIITDTEIILNARENSDNRFLEIRRLPEP